MRQVRALTTAATLTLGLVAPMLARSLTVSAHMDIYRAGGYNDGSDGHAPAVFTFPAGAGQILTFSSVTGLWSCGTGSPMYGPDGATSYCYQPGGQHFNNHIGPFAGYATTDFVEALTGMFLEDTLPASSQPPLRFYINDNSQGGFPTDLPILNPKIGQVFFIGDGHTGTGTGRFQAFQVPPTATHLYLGFTDNCGSPFNTVPGCYGDNSGSLTANFRIQPENLSWVQPASPSSPPGRCCAGMAYDRATRETVMFGGFGNPAFYGDTWAWRNGWTQLAPATSPSARQGPGMIWDGSAGNVMLFGGMTSDGTYLNDTWTWDGITWTQQFPPISPPARRFDTQGMAYDTATRRTVLFGGFDSSSNVLGDTWTWNGVTQTWTQQLPAASPFARRTTVAYDDAARTVVLFGGDNLVGAYYSDTWTWNGSTWTQQFPASAPSPRSIPAMAYDATIGAVVLFGGYGGPGENFNDTWTWDGTNWKQVNPASVPTGRWAAAMDYDPLAEGLVLFAGFGTTTLDDTWLFIPVR